MDDEAVIEAVQELIYRSTQLVRSDAYDLACDIMNLIDAKSGGTE